MGQAAANGLGISVTSFVTNAAAAGYSANWPVSRRWRRGAWRSVACGLAGVVVVIGLLPTREPVPTQCGIVL
jgi:hypothetical protein